MSLTAIVDICLRASEGSCAASMWRQYMRTYPANPWDFPLDRIIEPFDLLDNPREPLMVAVQNCEFSRSDSRLHVAHWCDTLEEFDKAVLRIAQAGYEQLPRSRPFISHSA
jgi:hypothetical protein